MRADEKGFLIGSAIWAVVVFGLWLALGIYFPQPDMPLTPIHSSRGSR